MKGYKLHKLTASIPGSEGYRSVLSLCGECIPPGSILLLISKGNFQAVSNNMHLDANIYYQLPASAYQVGIYKSFQDVSPIEEVSSEDYYILLEEYDYVALSYIPPTELWNITDKALTPIIKESSKDILENIVNRVNYLIFSYLIERLVSEDEELADLIYQYITLEEDED